MCVHTYAWTQFSHDYLYEGQGNRIQQKPRLVNQLPNSLRILRKLCRSKAVGSHLVTKEVWKEDYLGQLNLKIFSNKTAIIPAMPNVMTTKRDGD
jgi:hypothetical protein